ncbi:MAG TPA: glycosyltransferase family 2 protein [Saprospiraceae bacterium]|jgi:glycosyltransferase involved in cell wall biosynthesis|nr:glycosyltransferase family 2 protein [Saprospiraceae bacterium]HMV24240.1 glycosyltransferase family 2 protein [Saprospiraceae bacterium]HMX82283.1 glycosyltransferase family 2 protein [Saprospiraceae bacterium]HMX85740.1 glycosyltransferase family 2 protein [Saprospiraceae bacterium]HMZ74003.1 glycosyltransferase family 2 protein [Saprospiraceae bacterium]
MARAIIDVIIPAYNEELSIAKVIRDIPKDLVRNIIVCNNNSSDATAVVASTAGAIVADEPSPGYGNACLRGMAYIEALPSDEKPDILVFMDGDYSDYGEEMYELVKPILDDGMEMVIGSRALGRRERGSMTTPQVFGNWLSTTLIRWLYGYRFTDLGPYRAIRYPSLLALKMADRNFGWTVEMQVKAAKHKLKTTEIAVNYRKRIGTSKVSGTIKGSISAGYKILWTIGKLWLNN